MSVKRAPGGQKGGAGTPAARLLGVVRELAIELHPERKDTLRVGLDSRLDRELGFDSLARAELMLRLEHAFNVRLPQEVLGEAETPEHLLTAVLTANKFSGQAIKSGMTPGPRGRHP